MTLLDKFTETIFVPVKGIEPPDKIKFFVARHMRRGVRLVGIRGKKVNNTVTRFTFCFKDIRNQPVSCIVIWDGHIITGWDIKHKKTRDWFEGGEH